MIIQIKSKGYSVRRLFLALLLLSSIVLADTHTHGDKPCDDDKCDTEK